MEMQSSLVVQVKAWMLENLLGMFGGVDIAAVIFGKNPSIQAWMETLAITLNNL